MDSLNDTRQNTFEWQETMPLSGIVLDPPGASPAQSTDDSLHTSQSSSMVGVTSPTVFREAFYNTWCSGSSGLVANYITVG